MKQNIFKTFLVLFLILLLLFFYIYSPSISRYENFSIVQNETEFQDELLINYNNYLYEPNTNEIFIDQTLNDAKKFSNNTINNANINYITNNTIEINVFNHAYFDYKILIGNRSIDIYLDKNKPKQLQFFYYYTGDKPGIVRFYLNDGSLEECSRKHKAINSFILLNNPDGTVGENINYIFAYDLIENRPNVSYKKAKFLNVQNGVQPPTTKTQEQNEPFNVNDIIKSSDFSQINEIDCNVSLVGNKDMSSIINGSTNCVIRTAKGDFITSNVPFASSKLYCSKTPYGETPRSSPPTPSYNVPESCDTIYPIDIKQINSVGLTQSDAITINNSIIDINNYKNYINKLINYNKSLTIDLTGYNDKCQFVMYLFNSNSNIIMLFYNTPYGTYEFEINSNLNSQNCNKITIMPDGKIKIEKILISYISNSSLPSPQTSSNESIPCSDIYPVNQNQIKSVGLTQADSTTISSSTINISNYKNYLNKLFNYNNSLTIDLTGYNDKCQFVTYWFNSNPNNVILYYKTPDKTYEYDIESSLITKLYNKIVIMADGSISIEEVLLSSIQ